MFSVLFWVAFGTTIGWVAAIIHEEKEPKRISGLIVAGAIGGFAGGLLGGLLDPTSRGYHTGTTDITFAIFGATSFVIAASFAAKRHSDQQNQN